MVCCYDPGVVGEDSRDHSRLCVGWARRRVKSELGAYICVRVHGDDGSSMLLACVVRLRVCCDGGEIGGLEELEIFGGSGR